MSRAATEYRYEKLTWPDINQAVADRQVCIIPCGSVEQHGPHLPLDVDIVCPQAVACGAGRAIPAELLVLPTVTYGYTAHVMDFPGTINQHYDHFVAHVCDITHSLAYHGFKKIILLNGHGSNAPLLDTAARRTLLETDAECLAISWWNLLTIDPEFLPRWRKSPFPGGCSHACELETSLYLHVAPEDVRTEAIANGQITFNDEHQPYHWVDLFGAGPAAFVPWTSAYCETGVMGAAALASPEKGAEAYTEAVRQLVALVQWFRQRPRDVRQDRHSTPPTIPMPWGLQSVKN